MRLTFLGSGGGRFATITQRRMTGGFRIDDMDGLNLHVDPGPGALVRSYQFKVNPRKIDVLLVSHSHTDHYTDAEVLIEAMTRGMTRKRGYLIGSQSVIEGYKRWGPCISHYHLSKPQVTILQPGEEKDINKIKIRATQTVHGDPKGVGFKIKYEDFTLAYTSDTEYYPQLSKEHAGADVLIASVIRPANESIRGHMSANEFSRLVEEVSPKLAIMTHLGMKMILDHPQREAERISEQTGVKVLAAEDGMKIDLDRYHSHQETLDKF